MFVEITLAGIKHTISELQVKAFESLGWKRVPGADQGIDAGKKDAPSQKSPATKRKTK